jgi:hypothetical protein
LKVGEPAPTPREAKTNQEGGILPVYLLHFDTPYRHARHYLEYAADLDVRLAQHRAGRGARRRRRQLEPADTIRPQTRPIRRSVSS